MTEHQTLLLIEDDRALARGMQRQLSDAGFTVVWVNTGGEALKIAHQVNVQLILLDARLPDISGFDVLRQLRAESMRQPILMVTARDEESDRVLGLELGADDYIVKPFSLRELISRVRAALRRAYGELSAPAPGPRIAFGDIEIDLERLAVGKNGRPVFLTPTEFKLLRHLVGHPNQAMSREALMRVIWGEAGNGNAHLEDERAIDVYIRRLREKLEDKPSEPRWIATVRGVGYKFMNMTDL
jgi:DNA-binding response OmpR family regulator